MHVAVPSSLRRRRERQGSARRQRMRKRRTGGGATQGFRRLVQLLQQLALALPRRLRAQPLLLAPQPAILQQCLPGVGTSAIAQRSRSKRRPAPLCDPWTAACAHPAAAAATPPRTPTTRHARWACTRCAEHASRCRCCRQHRHQHPRHSPQPAMAMHTASQGGALKIAWAVCYAHRCCCCRTTARHGGHLHRDAPLCLARTAPHVACERTTVACMPRMRRWLTPAARIPSFSQAYSL